MLLNCDLGEGMAYDSKIMPMIDMANLACGAHAGSPDLMRENIIRAKEHGVSIGAHPGYPDKENFGRISLDIGYNDIPPMLIEQIEALDDIAKSEDAQIEYIKPHGALYNDMMKDPKLFEIIVRSIAQHDDALKLMILSTPQNDRYKEIADRYGIGLLYEIFADRNYTDDGYLVPRGSPDAVVHDIDQIARRIENFSRSGTLPSLGGAQLHMACDTICVHGDNRESLDAVKAIRAVLDG